MKKLALLLLFLFCSTSVYSQNKSTKTDWCNNWCKASVAAYATGFSLDAHSSWNKFEGTGIFTKDNGKFSFTKYSLYHSAVFGTTLLFQKNHPKTMNTIRFIGGAVLTGFAIRNYRIK